MWILTLMHLLSQDDVHSPVAGSTSNVTSKRDDISSITPPEVWGGERLSDKLAIHRQVGPLPSRLNKLTSGSTSASTPMFSGLHDPSSASQSASSYSTSLSLSSVNLRGKDVSSSQESLPGIPGHVPFSALPENLAARPPKGQANPEVVGPSSLNTSRRFTYAERISTSASFTDGVSGLVGSPKTKKTGAETREELLNGRLSRSDTSMAAESGITQSANVRTRWFYITFLHEHLSCTKGWKQCGSAPSSLFPAGRVIL